MKKTDPPIIIEQELNATKEEVWKTITELDQMKLWFFEQINSFEAKEGFKTEFVIDVGDRRFTHLWEIAEVKLHQRITYRWRYKEYPGDSLVTFELRENNEKVRIRLTTEVLTDFPQDIPEFKRESCIGGWNYFIKERLTNYLGTKN